MKSQPQASDSSGIVADRLDRSFTDMLKSTAESDGTSPLSETQHSSSSSFSTCESSLDAPPPPKFPSDDLLKFEKAAFSPSQKGARKSNADQLQSPRRSLNLGSPRRNPRRRASACDSVATPKSYSSQSTAKFNNSTTRRQASRNVKKDVKTAASLPPSFSGDNEDQRDMLRPQSDPRSLRRRHSMEGSLPERRSSMLGMQSFETARKDSILNTPLNRRRERHDRHLSKSLTATPQLWESNYLSNVESDLPTSRHRAPRRGSDSIIHLGTDIDRFSRDNNLYQRADSGQDNKSSGISNNPLRPEFSRTNSVSEFDIIAQRSKLRHVEISPPQRSQCRQNKNPRISTSKTGHLSPRRKMLSSPTKSNPKPTQPIPELVPVKDAKSKRSSRMNPQKTPSGHKSRRAPKKSVSEEELYSFLANINKEKSSSHHSRSASNHSSNR